MAIVIHHNLNKKKFKFLFAKYAYGCNPAHHCTNSIRGKYSKAFSKKNPDFVPGQTIVMDEFPSDTWDAIYICGVSGNGYAEHANYPHNVHIAILPKEGAKDHWEFEDWQMDIENGVFERIPEESELDAKYLELPEEYWSCRMFRWAVRHYRNALKA